jgi:outer membrane cobalamin receptor
VSAGRFEQDLGELTVSMEIIKPNIIENRNTVNIDEVLQQTPGVIIVDGEPQIRSGSGYSFGAGSRVMILVDGLPLLSGDAGRPSWGFLPVENVEQIEVIKGAASVLYGSAALSGVVNLRTAYATDKPKTKVIAFGGFYSLPQSKESVYWSKRPMIAGTNFVHAQRFGQWDVVLSGNFSGDDGYLGPIPDSLGNFSEKYNPFDVNRYYAESKARMALGTRWRSKKITGLNAGVNANWMKSESIATLVWDNAQTGLYSAYAGSATRTKQLAGYVDPYIEYLNDSGTRHSLRGRWQNLDNDNDNNQGNFSDVYLGEYQYQQNFDRWNIKDFNLTAGVMAQNTVGRSQLYTGADSAGANTARNLAGYLQLDKKFGRLTLSGGMRYEHFTLNGEHEARPVFRTGANYRLHEATFLRASYGQGYRFPTIAERFIQTAVGIITIYPNPELRSETGYNAEVGVKQGFKIGKFKGFADWAFFYQEYQDFIEFTFGQWDPNPSFGNFFGLGFKSLNTGTSRIMGTEVSVLATGKIREVELSFLGGYTYTVPQSTSPDLVYATSVVDPGNPLNLATAFQQTPDLAAHANLSYTVSSENPANNILKYRMQHLVRFDAEAVYEDFLLGASVRYNSRLQNIDKIFVLLDDLGAQYPTIFPSWGLSDWRAEKTTGDYVIDCRAGYNFTKTQRFSIVVSNLLNREYAIRPLAVEPGRQVVFQYQLHIG